MKISFCTQIKNRAWQLKQTLPVNLALLEGTEHEWIILDVGSNDNLSEIVQPFMSHPNFRYHREDWEEYRMAAAMNKAMSYGTGQILVSLDCDNYIGEEWLEFITEHPNHITHNWEGGIGDGTYGRISCPTQLWKILGGFCEDYICGAHDKEFVDKNRALVKYLKGKGKSAVLNSKNESKVNTPIGDWTWDEVCQDNAARMWERNISKVTLRKDLVGRESGIYRYRPTKPRSKVSLEYNLLFKPGFCFGEGGVLPGLCGSARRLSESPSPIPDFVIQPRWKENGELFLYIYRMWIENKYGTFIKTGITIKPGEPLVVKQVFDTGILKTSISGQYESCVDVNLLKADGYMYQIHRQEKVVNPCLQDSEVLITSIKLY